MTRITTRLGEELKIQEVHGDGRLPFVGLKIMTQAKNCFPTKLKLGVPDVLRKPALERSLEQSLIISTAFRASLKDPGRKTKQMNLNKAKPLKVGFQR